MGTVVESCKGTGKGAGAKREGHPVKERSKIQWEATGWKPSPAQAFQVSLFLHCQLRPNKPNGKACSLSSIYSEGLTAPPYGFLDALQTIKNLHSCNVRGALRQLKAEPTKGPCPGEPWWLLQLPLSALSLVFCYISKIRPTYVTTLVIYFSQSRGKHWKNERSSKNTSIWNNNLPDPRVTLQEVLGCTTLEGGTFNWLLLSGSLWICDFVSFLLSIHPEKYFKPDFFSYTSIGSPLFF